MKSQMRKMLGSNTKKFRRLLKKELNQDIFLKSLAKNQFQKNPKQVICICFQKFTKNSQEYPKVGQLLQDVAPIQKEYLGSWTVWRKILSKGWKASQKTLLIFCDFLKISMKRKPFQIMPSHILLILRVSIRILYSMKELMLSEKPQMNERINPSQQNT